MNRTGRLGILGGTFDPIHNGHLEAARAAQTELSLDRVLLLPSHVPPHRSGQPGASAFHRFAMAALAASQDPSLEACDIELRRTGMSYTSDTLLELHRDGWTAEQLFFILGADAFAEIQTWHNYPALLSLAQFAVITRPGYSVEVGQPFKAVTASTPDISATSIRRRVAAGESIDGLVPPMVANHIQKHRLYS